MTETEDSLQEYKDSMAGKSITEIGAEMKRMKHLVEKMDEALKAEKRKYDYIRMELIPDKFAEEDIGSIKLVGIGRIVVTGDMRVSVKGGKQSSMQAWLNEHGHGSLVKPTINSSSLKAWYKEQMKKGQDVPEDMLSVFMFGRASLTEST